MSAKLRFWGCRIGAGVGWTQHRLVWSSPFPRCVSSFSVALTAAWSNPPTLDSCFLDHFVFCFFDSALKMSRICLILSGSMASASIQSPLSGLKRPCLKVSHNATLHSTARLTLKCPSSAWNPLVGSHWSKARFRNLYSDSQALTFCGPCPSSACPCSLRSAMPAAAQF